MLESSEEPRFDLDAGALCLDFVNAAGDGGLSGYDDLLAFARLTEALSRSSIRRLEHASTAQAVAAEAVVGRAGGLAEALFRLLTHGCRTEPIRARDLERLNRELAEALGRQRLEPTEDGCCWSWTEPCDDLSRPLWPVARSAAELLTSSDLGRVRECASETCRRLFLDRSRNRSRKWCDMKICGNRAKARRHYRRATAAGSAGGP